MTVFVEKTERDVSAQSRLNMWSDCWDVMLNRPLVGVGPDHWPLVAPEYGWALGREAHSVWLQTGAELGFPGVGFLALFYLSAVFQLWRMAKHDANNQEDQWIRAVAQMVIVSVVGFSCAAQFVSLEALEVPYYVVLLGAGALKLSSQRMTSQPALAGSGHVVFANSMLRYS